MPLQHPDRGDVEGPGQRGPGRHRAPELPVVVLGHVTRELGRDVRHQRLGKDLAGVQHPREEEGLEDAPGASGAMDQVDRVARALADRPPAVADVRDHVEGAVVDHERGHVADSHGGQRARLPGHDVAGQLLKRGVEGAGVAASEARVRRREGLQEMGRGLRQGVGRVRQRFQEGKLQLDGVDGPRFLQSAQ